MALTSDVDSTGWTQLTSSTGEGITVTVLDEDVPHTIYFIASASDPGAGKGKPAPGDDAAAQNLRTGYGASFRNVGGSDHVWARTSAGTVRVYVTTAI